MRPGGAVGGGEEEGEVQGLQHRQAPTGTARELWDGLEASEEHI